ncbi:septum formation protein Maf [Baekduia soli]|uniref:Nucleoside triphosphate pyrophosphatase n=1 Tax=Baekduia soli TaxID=496014 RepID=A0A5B8U9G4_9ACTN|nr:Maf family protein [Baekduia soli]QEC49690.1 septum formation protein Maf [Baekduia soli]
MEAGRPRLVLASSSPQRRRILGDLGLDFTVRATEVAEEDEGAPRVVASENALRKALAGAAAPEGDEEVVLGCDTLVATEGVQIWGKPADEDAARATLRRLSGRTHEVVSGLALVRRGDVRAATEVTRVEFRTLDEDTITWYLGCGEWRGRAGGYAIQGRGAALVRRIEGDYLNVVGLPVAALIDLWPRIMRDHASPVAPS